MPQPRPNPAWTRRKTAAGKYQPKRIRLLLLGEAPPNEDRYFYFEDEESADELFAEVCNVLFEEPPQQGKRPYLKELRRRGVFLIDLKPDAPRTDEPLEPYVGPQLLNLDMFAPEKIIVIGPDAYDAAYSKMKQAKLPVVDVRVPLPATGHEPEFRQKFRQALVRADLEKLIRPLPAPKLKPEAG